MCFSKQDFAADNFYGKFPNKMFPKLILTQGMNNFIWNIEEVQNVNKPQFQASTTI